MEIERAETRQERSADFRGKAYFLLLLTDSIQPAASKHQMPRNTAPCEANTRCKNWHQKWAIDWEGEGDVPENAGLAIHQMVYIKARRLYTGRIIWQSNRTLDGVHRFRGIRPLQSAPCQFLFSMICIRDVCHKKKRENVGIFPKSGVPPL